MPAVTEQALLEALQTVADPHTGKDFVSTRQLKNLKIDGDDVAFDVERCLTYARQVNPGIDAIAVSATRGDGLAVHEQHDMVGVGEQERAHRGDHGGAALPLLRDRGADSGLGVRVHRARRLDQDEHGRIDRQRPGQPESLPLTAGETAALLLDDPVEAGGLSEQDIARPGRVDGLDQSGVGEPVPATARSVFW